jgi:hypothetical protein
MVTLGYDSPVTMPSWFRTPSSLPFSRSRGLFVLAVVVALGVALAAGILWRADRRQRAEWVAEARELGLADAGLERDLRWAADGDRARLVLGRALVFAGLGEDGSARADASLAARRFERAAAVAEEVLRSRPTDREAATLAGAARYLAWSTARDPRLVTEHERWEEPLRLARRLGPGDREAARFLAMAYLELWSSLAESKRAEAREIVAVAFEDINTFYRLIDPWLAVAGTGAEGLASIPPQSAAWVHVAERIVAGGRIQAYCGVLGRLADARSGELAARLADARQRLALGEPADARARFLAALADVPPDGRFLPELTAALAETPAGTPDPPRAAGLRAWLRFALDQTALGRPVLDERKFATLTRAAGLVLPEPDAPDATLALAAESALAASDLVAAERFERQAAALTTATWSSYWLAKARLLAERADTDNLRRALAALAVAAPEGSLAAERAHVRRIAASHHHQAAELAAAETELAALDLGRWDFEAWQVAPNGSVLDFHLARTGRTLRLDLVPEKSPGGVAVVRLDGREVLCRALGAPAVVTVTVPLEPGLHRLEVQSPKGLGILVREMVAE